MDDSKKLSELLEVRRQALIQELEMVHTAISRISEKGQITEDTKQWVKKLNKWHEELQDLLDRIPKENQR
jgi:hypothetical protein